MEESREEKKATSRASPRRSLIEGIFFGFISLFFLYGFLSSLGERGGFYHTQDYIFQVMAALCCGGLSVAAIGLWLGKSWAERLEEIVLAIIFLGLMTGIISWIFKAALIPDKRRIFHGWEATVLVLMVLWILIWLLIFIPGIIKRSRKESLLVVLFLSFFWPFIMFMKMPHMIIVLGIPVGFIAIGDHMGRRYNHPFIGAILGLALCVAIAVLTIRIKQKAFKK